MKSSFRAGGIIAEFAKSSCPGGNGRLGMTPNASTSFVPLGEGHCIRKDPWSPDVRQSMAHAWSLRLDE